MQLGALTELPLGRKHKTGEEFDSWSREGEAMSGENLNGGFPTCIAVLNAEEIIFWSP